MSASEPNRPELPPSRDDLAMAPTQALRPEEPSSQLVSLLDGYLAELQSGRQPNRQKLLAEHPELAAQLEQCLSGIEFIHRASGPATKSGMPTQLGDFRIVREVGRGGMGVVYEAEQISLKRRVALKVLRFGAASDTEAMQRFQREAETVAGLHHTNIVPIFAIGCEQGVNYYAMQFIEGRSLACSDRIHAVNGPDKSGHYELAGWGLQAAEALAHAHQRGVIHRDIKPSNLILDPDGRIWLTDFGLAKRMDDVSLSMAGAILGTPRYMSPEQAAAAKQPVDHRTDIYSLGATLYELATGRPLFEADSPHAVITQILTTEPPRPRVVCPNLHRDFETIILKCLAKEPAQRYATAQALADDLRAFVEGRAIRARRATFAEQAARWFKQQRRSVGVAATAVAATVLVVIGSLIAWQMHAQSRLGYLTLNTPRDGAERAEVAEVLTLDDEPVGAPFTLPTKEPLALPEGAYRLRLTAPSKVSQTYLLDIAAGAQQTHEVGLVNETVGYPITLRSPVGVEVVQSSRHVPRDVPSGTRDRTLPGAIESQTTKAHHVERDGYIATNEPRLFVGPQDQSKPTLRCYSGNSQPGWNPDGSRADIAPLWEADWRLEAPGIMSFLKLPEDREAWKVVPAQTDVFAWQQVLSWFDPWWFRNGAPPQIISPAQDLNGDGVVDVIWAAPRQLNPFSTNFGSGPLTPKAAVLVAASGKDGQPLWWFRPQDAQGNAARLLSPPVSCGGLFVTALRSTGTGEVWIEGVDTPTGESRWRSERIAVVPQTSIWMSSLTLPDGNPGVLVVGGTQLLVLNAQTGTPQPGPQPSSTPGTSSANRLSLQSNEPILDVRFADLDGDGVTEALLTVQTSGRGIRDIAFSVTQGKPLWEVPSSFEVGAWHQNEPRHGWPLLADLDGDDKPEVILPGLREEGSDVSDGCRVLNGVTGEIRWTRRFPRRGGFTHHEPEQFTIGPDFDGDGRHEVIMASIRSEYRSRSVGSLAPYQQEEKFLYVDCFSGRDGSSVWWQRIPLGMSDYAAWTGTVGEMLWWQSSRHAPRDEPSGTRDRAPSGTLDTQTTKAHHAERDGYRLVIPVHRHPDSQVDRGAHSIYVLSAATGRIEHQADDVAFPKLVDWNDDGLDDLAVYLPDDPIRFGNPNYYPDKPSGKFVVLRGSPPEAFRRLGRWTEEQDFDGDGVAELSKRHDGSMGRMGDYAVLIASGRDGRLLSKWKTEWPETPHSFTVGDVQSFPPPLGDFDGDGLADLLISREGYNWDFERGPLVKTGQAPLLMQAISSKTGKRIWGGVPLTLPDWLRPTNANENSEEWSQQRNGRLHPVSTQAVDVDGDGQPEVLQALRLTGYRRPEKVGDRFTEHQQPFVALIDARAGMLRWFEPISEIVVGDHAPGLGYLRIDASADLNGDGTRDLVLTVPQQDKQGWWSLSLQVHSGRDGKMLWGPKLLEGTSVNNNDFNPPMLRDLDGDGRPEIVLMPTNQPHVTVLRGDTGEPLWTWKGSQPQYFAAPGIAVVQSSRHAPRDESRRSIDVNREKDVQPTNNADSALGSPHAEREGYIKRCVVVAFNETGSQWNLVLLDHTGQELEKVPCGSNQVWSHDLDGDGGEELLRYVETGLTASRGLHEVLWRWTRPRSDYGWISDIERAPDGRVIVVTAGSDSITLLDGKTGQPFGRTFKSTNTSLNENGRNVDLNSVKLNSAGEATRLLTRVGDGQLLLGHVVSRAVLPTDEDGRYQSSRHVPRDEPSGERSRASQEASESRTTKAHHAERDGYFGQSAANDPRLVRNLMWAPTPDQWANTRSDIFREVLISVGLSFVLVLIPYWLIRAGVRRRELGWRRGALVASGAMIIVACLALFRFAPPGAVWRDVPWLLPITIGIGGLPIVMFPATAFGAFLRGDWRRIRWLLIATIVLSLLLGALQMVVDLSRKSPEQHYSWFGWWMIFVMGAYFTGGCLVLGHVFGPAVRWLWSRIRRQPSV